MVRVRTTSTLSPAEHRDVSQFLDDEHTLGVARLNDHLRLDLAQGPRDGFAAAIALGATTGATTDTTTDGTTDGTAQIVGYAQASVGNDGFVIDGIVSSQCGADAEAVRLQLLDAVLAELPPDASVTWWARDVEGAAGVAASLGMHPDRQLLMMQRDLPIDVSTDLAVRPFEVDSDEAAWLEVNNAAFQWHGEQGGWDLATLRQREREPWFDPKGFLLHERDDRLAGFCWTKMHDEGELVGEIYVVAVHPDFHGLGLGRALTIAGLLHMQSVAAVSTMLYVDATNTSAVHLYETLGFTIARTDQSYLREP